MSRRLIFETCANCGAKIEDDEKAILVDDHNDLIFCDDNCVREFFEEEIAEIEKEMLGARTADDITIENFKTYESYLPLLIGEPDEVWEKDVVEEEHPKHYFIGEFFHENDRIFYIAVVYSADGKAAFIYTHFATRDPALVEKYRQGQLIYDSSKDTDESGIEDDEVTSGSIAIELYNEMLENRSDSDIDPEDFTVYTEYKIQTVEKPQEIWKRIDDLGITFLVYVAHSLRETETIGYIVVAVEDELTEGAIPIFGFPTLDQKLLDRFRQGELVFKNENDS